MLFVNQETRAERLSICKACPHYVTSTRTCGPILKGKKVKKVQLCGCVMPVKAQFKMAACPLGKWQGTITQVEAYEIAEFLGGLGNDITAEQNAKLAEYYAKATGVTATATTCSSCLRDRIREIKNLLANDADQHALSATPRQ